MDTDTLKYNSATIDHLLTRLHIQNQNKHTALCICNSHSHVNDTLACMSMCNNHNTDRYFSTFIIQSKCADTAARDRWVHRYCMCPLFWQVLTDCSNIHTRRMQLHCGVSVSELYRAFIGNMVVNLLHVCNVSAQCTLWYLYKFMHRQSGLSA